MFIVLIKLLPVTFCIYVFASCSIHSVLRMSTLRHPQVKTVYNASSLLSLAWVGWAKKRWELGADDAFTRSSCFFPSTWRVTAALLMISHAAYFAPRSFGFETLSPAIFTFWMGGLFLRKAFPSCGLEWNGTGNATVDLHTVIWTGSWIALPRPHNGKYSAGCSKCEPNQNTLLVWLIY